VGHVERLPNGKYRVRYYDGTKNAKGRPKLTTSDIVDTRLEADVLNRELEKEVRRQRDVKRPADAGRLLSMSAVLTRWSQSRIASGRIAEGRSFEVIHTLTPILEAEGWTTTAAITAEAVDRWRVQRLEKGGSDNPLRYLQAVLNWASKPPLRQPVDPGVLTLEKQVRDSKVPPALITDKQLQQCLERAREKGGENVYQAFKHLATYGCRPTELCKIKIRDFDPVAGTITYSKTKNRKRVTHPLLPEDVVAYNDLSKDRLPDDPLFTNPWGEAWWLGKRGQAAEITNWWRENVSQHLLASAQRGIYCLKDYAISSMEDLGIDDRTKATFTGHSTLAVFARYKATNLDRARGALRKMGARVFQNIPRISKKRGKNR
jgi:integrase